MADRLRKEWSDSGLLVLPGFLRPDEIPDLRRICDRVLEQILAENPRQADSRNIAYLTEQRYFADETDLLRLLEFIADERIVSLLTELAGEPPLFHNTQYFYEPRTRSHDGEWHRDTQFLAPESELERARMRQHTGVHFRVALLPDAQLEVVPGSHTRWDTPEEFAIRKGPDPTQAHIPGRMTVHLNAGDACLFHAWGIHRGTYRTDRPRRTLDIIYGWGGICDYAVPPPMCFSDPGLVAKLSPGARRIFEYFVRSYAPLWGNAS